MILDNYGLIFLGFNSMFTHKRGVENVIHFQLDASPFSVNYYLHWDTEAQVRRYEKLICIGIKKNIFWFVTLNVLLIKLKKRKKKIFIHSHNPLMSLMSIFQTNILTVHDALYYLTGALKHKFYKVFWLLEKILYLRCRYIHFISNYAKKVSLFKNNKNFIVIPNTSHLETFISNNLSGHDNTIKFNNRYIKVFTVRSIEERALINLIIKVAERLKGGNIVFLIAGKGPLYDLYNEEIKKKKLENIKLLGYVCDDILMQYYKECDLVLVPAAYGEGFGLPIIEAYLCNKPCIASNVCAIPEVVISNDFLFENTVESVISKLYFAIDQNNIQYRSYYYQRFSNKVVISKMNELYKKLL